MHLVGFTTEIYYDTRPCERQTRGTSRCDVAGQQKMTPVSHSLANGEAAVQQYDMNTDSTSK